jgi:hypothetical protein
VAGGYRVDAENFVIELAVKGVRSSVVRLPPITHSSLDRPPRLRPFADRLRPPRALGVHGDDPGHRFTLPT